MISASVVKELKKKILHDITQKSLNKLNKQFKRDHGTSFTTGVKKEERKRTENKSIKEI